MIKHSAAAGLALALVAGSAFAADLPSYKAPIIAPPPVFTWTGLYGGVNIGYGFGNGDRDYGDAVFLAPSPAPLGTAWSISNDLNGVLGGGQVGYNYQFNPWLVVGLEADIQATDVHSQGLGVGAAGSSVAPAPFAPAWIPHFSVSTQNKSVDWFGTVRGRIGVTFPSFPALLVYGTGGLAYGGVVHSFNVSEYSARGVSVGSGTNYDSTNVGWTAGAGFEWFPLISSPLFKAFSVKLEYLYTDLGPTTVYGGSIGNIPAAGLAFAYQQTSQTRFHAIRLGVNWHFNPFVAAPVLAKY